MMLVWVLHETIFLQVLVQVFVLRGFSFADSRTESDYFINWTSLSWIQTVEWDLKSDSEVALQKNNYETMHLFNKQRKETYV